MTKRFNIASKSTNHTVFQVIAAFALFCAIGFQSVFAEFSVRRVDAAWVDDIYDIDARMGLYLSSQAIEALHKGVTLTLVVEVEVERFRRYWLNEQVASLEQRYLLNYHALSDQYVVTFANTGLQTNFPSLQAALDVLGTVINWPLIDRGLIHEDSVYRARLRVKLDINALPAPLRVMAYVWPGWRLASEWHTWTLNK